MPNGANRLRILGLALAASVALSGSDAAAQDMAGAATRLSDAVSARSDCLSGVETLIGVFPFDETRLPLAPASAFALYEAFLGDLLSTAPDCIRFIDGRGAFVTLEYLGRGELLRESGQQQRARIRETLGRVDYTLDGALVETGGALAAIFRLTEMATGAAVGRAEFSVPARFRGEGCGVGALPEAVAMRDIARRLIDRAGGVQTLVVTGARHGPSESATSAGRFLEDLMLDALAREVENVITGAVLRVTRSDVPRAPTLGEHALYLVYWPCEDDGAARLSVTLRSADGQDLTEQRAISLADLPAGLALHPTAEAVLTGDLMVTPALVTVGDELALLAGPPVGCSPFFFNLAPSGRLTPIPLRFFRQLDLGGGLVRYEISPQWDFGLVVQDDDEPGLNRLGYLCQPAQALGDAALRGLLRAMRDQLDETDEGLIAVGGSGTVYFQTRGFEIVR